MNVRPGVRVVLACLAWVSVGGTPPASAQNVVQLAGVTTVVAPAGNARMPVVLPKTVHFAGGYLDVPFVSVTGTAQAAAVYLIPAGTTIMRTDPVMFGLTPRSAGGSSVVSRPGGNDVVTAGKYVLVVVHTPGTATVRLTLPGLPGRMTLRPTQRTGAHMSLLSPPALATAVFPPTGSSGAVGGVLAGRGFIDIAGELDLALAGASQQVLCMQPPGDPLPAAVAFLPGCPTEPASVSNTAQGTQSFQVAAFLNYAAGTYNAGYTYATTGAPTAVGGWAVWMPYSG